MTLESCRQEKRALLIVPNVLLVFVEISSDPGHCDDEGKDGEAYDEQKFIAHDGRVGFNNKEVGVRGREICIVYRKVE